MQITLSQVEKDALARALKGATVKTFTFPRATVARPGFTGAQRHSVARLEYNGHNAFITHSDADVTLHEVTKSIRRFISNPV